LIGLELSSLQLPIGHDVTSTDLVMRPALLVPFRIEISINI
jgi:hypothetical protein